MKRREFIKIVGAFCATSALPVTFINYEDGETRFLRFLAENYNVLGAFFMLKMYCRAVDERDKGIDTKIFFKDLKNRQPHFIKHIRAAFWDLRGEHYGDRMAFYRKSMDRMHADNWRDGAPLNREYNELANRFGLPTVEIKEGWDFKAES